MILVPLFDLKSLIERAAPGAGTSKSAALDWSNMASANYRLFHAAILGRKQITCIYRDRYREICPHILGHSAGEEKALAYQFAGESKSGLPPRGEWRCLFLADVRDALIRDGAWHSGSRHSTTQVCVDHVDIDVNWQLGV